MDYRNEMSVGDHVYTINAKGEPAQDGHPPTVTLEFTGGDENGRVIAEGNVLVAVEGLDTATRFLTQTLGGLAALHGQGARGRARSARPLPPNAGKPWTDE